MKYKIGFLTYRKLDKLARSAIEKLKDDSVEIVLLEGFMEDLIEKVQETINDGVDVFIGGGANAHVISEYTEANMLTIELTVVDYLEAITRARELGKKIGIVTYKKPINFNIKKFEDYMDVNINSIVFNDKEELENKLIESDVEVIIGGAASNEVADKLNIKNILIYPGEDTIINIIKEAKEITIALKREREKSKIMQTILDYNTSGIIATNEEGKVIIYNPKAEEILGISSDIAMGSLVNETIPECGLKEVIDTKESQLGVIKEICNNDIVVHRVPIEIGENTIGALAIIQPVSEIQKTERRVRNLNREKGFNAKHRFSDIIGSSRAIKNTIEEAKIFSRSNSNLLIYGDTGVGKEIIAQSIHNNSQQSDGAFVAINCAALPESLLESELFGYAEGAFTGSKKGGKPGLFELAHEGTILLDEIGEIAPSIQARLLRVLEEKEVRRVGGDRIIPIDVRVISATNKNLEKKVPREFRMDLLYRLNTLQLEIPPLKEREQDVIEIFLKLFLENKSMVNYNVEFGAEELEILKSYSWPGNIREVINVVERFSLFLDNTKYLDDSAIKKLLIKSIGQKKIIKDILKQNNIDVKTKDNLCKDVLNKLYNVCPGDKEFLAECLGISRTTLWRLSK